MQANELFLETLEDLRARTHLRAGEYDMVQAAGLLRRLLVDATPLVDPVNRSFKLKIQFKWSRLRVATEARGGGAWVPGSWFDPVLAEVHTRIKVPEHADDIAQHPPFEGKRDSFLAHDAIVRGQEKVTVKDLISHYANREGGVHYDPRPAKNLLLSDIQEHSEDAVRFTIQAIGRISYRALEPLASAVMLSERTGTFGLAAAPEDFTGDAS